MRCGNALVQEGDSARQVLDRCGQPMSVEPRGSEPVILRPNAPHLTPNQARLWYGETTTGTVPVEVWHYNCGAYRFFQDVHLKGGRVTAIETLSGHGSGPQRCN